MMQRVTEGTLQDELRRHGLIAASRAQNSLVGRFEGVRLRRRRGAYVIKFTVDANLVSMIENVKRERRTTVDIRVATNENTARTAVLPSKGRTRSNRWKERLWAGMGVALHAPSVVCAHNNMHAVWKKNY